MGNDLRQPTHSLGEIPAVSCQGTFRQEAGPPLIPESQSELPPLADCESSDHWLVGRSREGDQQAAAELYVRYATRLTILVERQCSKRLARCAGVDDIVQSVFGSFFRKVGQGHYQIPDGAELWKLLLVIALNKIRTKATYYHAAKRDAHRTVGGAEAEKRIERHGASVGSTTDLVFKDTLERLPAQNQFMFRLRLDGCEIAEIARTTGRSRRTVERILQETRVKLQDLLREDG